MRTPEEEEIGRLEGEVMELRAALAAARADEREKALERAAELALGVNDYLVADMIRKLKEEKG